MLMADEYSTVYICTTTSLFIHPVTGVVSTVVKGTAYVILGRFLSFFKPKLFIKQVIIAGIY